VPSPTLFTAANLSLGVQFSPGSGLCYVAQAGVCALIGACVGSMCADDSDAQKSKRQTWQTMMSDAYNKKCKVLTAMGHYSSALHFGRLSSVLDTGEFKQPDGVVEFLIILLHVFIVISLNYSYY